MHDPVRKNSSRRWSCALLGALGFPWLLWGFPAGAQTLGKDVTQGLTDGAFDLEFRYRYEFVDEAAFDKNANASILWSRLTYRSAAIRNFALILNLDNVAAIAAKDYNSTRNGRTSESRVGLSPSDVWGMTSCTCGMRNSTAGGSSTWA